MVDKIIVVSGSDSDFRKLKKLVLKTEGIIVPWICFINNKNLPEHPTYNNNKLCDGLFDSGFIIISQQIDDQETVEFCVKETLVPILQKCPKDNIAIIVHDNDAVKGRMAGGKSLFYQLSNELHKERITNVLIWPFYHEISDWIYPELDDFISKVTMYAQKETNNYFKEIRTSLENLKRKFEKDPYWVTKPCRSLHEDVHLIKHDVCNIFTFMTLKVNKAKTENDIVPLLELELFKMGDILKKYRAIEHEVAKLTENKIKEIELISTNIKKIVEFVEGIKKPGINLAQALKLSDQCLEKTRFVCMTLTKLGKVIHE